MSNTPRTTPTALKIGAHLRETKGLEYIPLPDDDGRRFIIQVSLAAGTESFIATWNDGKDEIYLSITVDKENNEQTETGVITPEGLTQLNNLY